MTIYTIAKKANISAATVSRALNPATQHKVAKETLRKIDALAKQLRYTPNLAARNLRKTKYDTIGLVVPHFEGLFSHEYYTTILSGVSDALLGSSYRFKLVMLKEGKTNWSRHNFKASEGVDGLIIVYCPNFHADKKTLEHIDVPCVVLNDYESKVKAHFICGDNFLGGQLAAEHLFSQGHRHIAVLKGPDSSSDSSLRLKGFQSYFKRNKLETKLFILKGGNNDEPEAARVTEAFIKSGQKASAFFCLNDRMAFGVLKKLRELNIPCPARVSVMGYDDNLRAGLFEPPLTTIRVPLYDMAKEAVRCLLGHLENNKKSGFYYQQTVFPVTLVIRKSVALFKAKYF